MRRGTIASAGLLTLAIWAAGGLVLMSTMIGDCFPDMAARCPTDHERNRILLRDLIIIFAMNFGAVGLMLWLRGRRGKSS
jgi:hypothetical protein